MELTNTKPPGYDGIITLTNTKPPGYDGIIALTNTKFPGYDGIIALTNAKPPGYDGIIALTNTKPPGYDGIIALTNTKPPGYDGIIALTNTKPPGYDGIIALTNTKPPGYDGICSKHIKDGHPYTAIFLSTLFTICLLSGSIIEEWRKSRVRLLSRTKCANSIACQLFDGIDEGCGKMPINCYSKSSSGRIVCISSREIFGTSIKEKQEEIHYLHKFMSHIKLPH